MTTITEEELELHRKYLNGEPGGVRLNKSRADLQGINLCSTDLAGAELDRADLTGANLGRANLRSTDLRGANLTNTNLDGADLRFADLRRADLTGANIDFASWSLWCGTKAVKVDRKIAAQLAAHFCALDCDDPDYQAARAAILAFAKTSHRAKELGLLDEPEVTK